MTKENVYKRYSEERAMKRCLALLVAGEMGIAVRCLGQLDGIREDAMMRSLNIQDNETCSHSRSTSARYWSAVFPGEISAVQGQQGHPSGRWFISGQLILSKSLKKSQRATVSEHTNGSKPIIRILDCSEKKVCLLSSNDTSKNYNIQRGKEAKYFNISEFWHVPFEIPE